MKAPTQARSKLQIMHPLLFVILGYSVATLQTSFQSNWKMTLTSLPRSDTIASCTPELCRTEVFIHQGQGGLGTFESSGVNNICSQLTSFGVCEDLKQFTGLREDEWMKRMKRVDNFHFEGEHMFWNPQSSTELAWYYSSSVSYLFANALHPADASVVKASLEKGVNEPVLDYSGGVGNNIIYLAEKGFQCQYFGIGVMEKAFSEYRFQQRGYLENGLVEIKHPFVDGKFDPIQSVLPGNESLGAILALDVLEHIPNYHKVVMAMVESLKVGGVIIENSPFGVRVEGEGEDTRVHVGDGGISMAQAMGPRMQRTGQTWTKITGNAAQ
jgi:SAM-dependent methyltransferase